jgi:hypothetical protein
VVTRRVKTGGAYVGAGGLGAPSPPQWQNTYEDQEFTGAYVADPGGGPDQWQYSGGGIAYYIDPSFGAGGDGSYASPWDDFTEVNALTGDLGGRILRLRSNQIIYDQLYLQNADNFTIETYGGSPLATIDGSVLTAYTWTQASTSPNLWWAQPGSAIGLFIDDVATLNCANQQQVTDLEYGWWYGTRSGNLGDGSGTQPTGNALVVNLPPGESMTTLSAANLVRRADSTGAYSAVHLANCNAATLQNFAARRGYHDTIRIEANASTVFSDIALSGLTVSQCGYTGTSGQNLINIYGAGQSYLAPGISVTDCLLHDNVTGNNSNGIETGHLTGPTIARNTFRRIYGNAIEYWRGTHQSVISRNSFDDIGARALAMFWGSGTDYDNHTGNSFENNIVRNLGNFRVMGTQTPYPTGQCYNTGSGILASGGTNNRAYNNTFILSDAPALEIKYSATEGGNSGSFSFMNNTVVLLEPTTNAGGVIAASTPTSGWTIQTTAPTGPQQIQSNYNRYFTRRVAASGVRMQWNAGSASTYALATWQAFGGDTNSTLGDPAYTAPFGTGGTSAGTLAATTYGSTHASFVAANAGLVQVTGHGLVVGDYVSMPITGGSGTAPTWYTRVGQVLDANTFRAEYHLYGNHTIATGATVTKYPNVLSFDFAPTTTPPLNSGIGSATDANVPTVDFYGNARSTTAPDIGAVEV